MISLGARKVAPLKRAFEILRSWDRRPGDDGFDLEFVLLRSDGYLITICPEFEGLRGRVAKADRFFSPLGINVSWIFELTRQGPWIPDFRRYLAQAVSPFIFSGCEFVSEDRPPRHTPNVPAILKFKARFSEESQSTLSPFGKAILEMRSKTRDLRKARTLPPKPEQTPRAILDRRSEQLRRHFPVTLHRLELGRRFEDFRNRNSALNVTDWQYTQAYCNALLSIEMSGLPHYQNISPQDLVGIIADRLAGRIELANMVSFPQLADSVLIKQMSLDAGYLLGQRGYRKLSENLGELGEKLVTEGLL